MDDDHQYSGLEFDWFAADEAGELALFSTAGAGFIPARVLEATERHADLVRGIENPEWGNEAVWDVYSELGLYVFNWDLQAGPYLRARTPAHPIATDFRKLVLGLPDLPEYPGRFRDTEAIRENWCAV